MGLNAGTGDCLGDLPFCIFCEQRPGVVYLIGGVLVDREPVCLPCLAWLNLPLLADGSFPPVP